MEKEEYKKAFEAGREKEYHYGKSGIDTGYYTKWDSFDEWYNKVVLSQANVIKSVCPECKSDKIIEQQKKLICQSCFYGW